MVFDLAPYCTFDGVQEVKLPIEKCVDKKAVVSFVIRSSWLKELDGQDDDAISSVSDLTTLQTTESVAPASVAPRTSLFFANPVPDKGGAAGGAVAAAAAVTAVPAANDIANLADLQEFDLNEDLRAQLAEAQEDLVQVRAELSVATGKADRMVSEVTGSKVEQAKLTKQVC